MKNTLLAIACTVSLCIYLTGCFGINNQTQTKPIAQPTALTQDGNNQVATGIGTYIGQIDNSSIEMKMDNAFEQKSTAFRLDYMIMENFNNTLLNTGDRLKISYFMNENNQPVITKFEKLDKQ